MRSRLNSRRCRWKVAEWLNLSANHAIQLSNMQASPGVASAVSKVSISRLARALLKYFEA